MYRPAEGFYRDGGYQESNPGWHEEDSAWKAGHAMAILRDNDVRPATVCEVGCGAGEILNCMEREWHGRASFVGYDISPQAIAMCRPKERANLRFHLGDALASSAAIHDLVMAMDVFEHVEDYLGFLRKLRTRGRYKLFHIPLDLSVQSVLRAAPILEQRRAVGHLHYFTKETALASLVDTGYRIVDCRYTSTALDLPNRSWKARLMKAPRKLLFSLNPDLAARLLGGFSLLVLAE